jgi:hypothetical protein
MAIKLTDSNYTSGGTTTELYFHITEFYRNKEGKCTFPVKYFLNETKETEVKIFENVLKNVYNIELGSEEIGTDAIEVLAYGKIGALLKEGGLTPQGDDTGSWVAY